MRKRGVVLSWSKRGFGFVVTEERQQYFLHVRGLANLFTLPAEGDLIEFDVAPAQKPGLLPLAVNAVIVPAKAVR
jgi:cold shock CspA family protein